MGYFSIFINLETCKCPEVVSTSYYKLPPYTYEENGKMNGMFVNILKDMVPFICWTCHRLNGATNTTVNFKVNGRNYYAERPTELKAIQQIDQFTDVTFPVVGTQYLDEYLSYPYIPVIQHPGVVLIGRDKSINEVVIDILRRICILWPLLVISLLLMITIGFSVWFLVSLQ